MSLCVHLCIYSLIFTHICIGNTNFYCLFPFPSKVKLSSLRLFKNAVAKLFNQLGFQKVKELLD